MELTYTELVNNELYTSQNSNTDLQYGKYWEETPVAKMEPTKKKRVSFDDILQNMNLVVNKDGALQFMAPKRPDIFPQENINHTSTSPVKNIPPIDPVVKHSYIYNKYFKDYREAYGDIQPERKIPKTKEEYYQMLAEERRKAIEQKRRIEEIKSKKLMFTTTTTTEKSRIISTQNKLRSMNFH